MPSHPTVPDLSTRLARLEVQLANLEADLHALLEHVHGGPSVPYKRSIDGRIYDVRQTLLAAEKLSEAVREVRRERTRAWATWQKVALFVCAAITAVAAVIAAVTPLFG